MNLNPFKWFQSPAVVTPNSNQVVSEFHERLRRQQDAEQQFMKESILSMGAIQSEYEQRLKTSFGKDYQTQALMASLFSKAATKKREIVIELEDLKNFYLVQTLLSLFLDDAFAPSVHDGNILEVSSKNKNLQKKIDDLDQKIGFDNFITEVAYDFMLYGDFCLGCEVAKDKGIVSIDDNVWQQGIVPVTKLGSVVGYLVLTDRGKIELKEPSSYIRFALGPYGTRIDLYEEFDGIIPDMEVFKNLPRYVKIGRSLIHPVKEKLRELQVLEGLVPATKLAKLTSGSLVGIQVPASMDPDAAFKTCRRVEDLINKKVAVNPRDRVISIENVLSSAGKIKVVPVFGDKGTLNKMDYKMEEPDDLLSSIEDIRRAIMSAAGYPYELLYGGESGDKKSELLKKYARYLMRLRSIQATACNGLTDMITIDLVNRGESFNRSDIEVKFKQRLLEINNTETLEFMDITVSYLDNLQKFITELQANEKVKFDIDVNVLQKFLNENLSLTGLEGVVKSAELVNLSS